MNEMEKVVDRINKENELKYGKIQKCCNQLKNYCRCESYKVWLKEFDKPKTIWRGEY